jgi:CHAD domain-containing protein
MTLLEQRKSGTASGETMGNLLSPAAAHDGRAGNCLRASPVYSLAQLRIERMVSAMGIAPRNILISFELSNAVAEQWANFERMLRRCRRESSAEAVHDTRVHCRRLIARLVLVELALSAASLHAVLRSLKRLLKSLGELRDVQVQKLALTAELSRHPEVGGLWIELGRRERELIRSASHSVSQFKTGKLRRRLEALQAELENPAARLAAKSVLGDSIIRATQQAFDEVVQHACAVSRDDVSTVHRVRTAYKKFRYMVESLPATVGRPSEAQLSAMAEYQQGMGSIQDVEVLLGFLTGYVAHRAEASCMLEPFRQALFDRRRRLVHKFMALADTLYSFWPLQSVAPEIRQTAVSENRATELRVEANWNAPSASFLAPARVIAAAGCAATETEGLA